jgi:GTPases - Sulfate adenylate transferase subunit 1
VVKKSERTPWYKGTPLLKLLEEVPVRLNESKLAARFPVQYVIRPYKDDFHDYRGYAGRIAGGDFKVGDQITVLPSGTTSTIIAINEGEKDLKEAFAPQSVALRLSDNVDISRGDMIVKEEAPTKVGSNISLMISWLNHRPLRLGGKYIIRHTTDEVRGVIKDIRFKVNINNLEKISDESIVVGMNDIAHITLKTSRPLKYDSYANNRTTGSLVIIDEYTFETVGAGMIVPDLEDQTFAI